MSCAHSRMTNGGTLNWKMWVFKLCLDTYKKNLLAQRAKLLNAIKHNLLNVSVFPLFCREWLCWWWAQQRPCLRSLLSGPCLWRTWLRSSWPQRWVSLKITSTGKTNMVIAVFHFDFASEMTVLQGDVHHVENLINIGYTPFVKIRSSGSVAIWKKCTQPRGPFSPLVMSRWSCPVGWQTWATPVTWMPQCSVCAPCQSSRLRSEGGFSAVCTEYIQSSLKHWILREVGSKPSFGLLLPFFCSCWNLSFSF